LVLEHKAADEITIIFKSFGIKRINKPVVTSNKQTNILRG
jgi:hypothetical protein